MTLLFWLIIVTIECVIPYELTGCTAYQQGIWSGNPGEFLPQNCINGNGWISPNYSTMCHDDGSGGYWYAVCPSTITVRSVFFQGRVGIAARFPYSIYVGTNTTPPESNSLCTSVTESGWFECASTLTGNVFVASKDSP